MNDLIGVVVIGRNEGDRLVRCLASTSKLPCVYVDSGSTDQSIENAREASAEVVELDMSIPFTAARARNAGYEQLLETHPNIEFIQFVDGDCEINADWIEQGLAALQQNETLAAVCGRRREKYPLASKYNLMCDIEWDTPVGTADACGGDAIYRVSALLKVDGFDERFIAGEEPELCFRLRHRGFQIERLDAEMTLHDADMHRFGQWWKRHKRSGYAFALNAEKHGKRTPAKHNVKEVNSIVMWSLIYMAFAWVAVLQLTPVPLILLAILIALQTFRIALKNTYIRKQYGTKASLIYAFFTMIGKWPQFLGVVKHQYESLFKKQAKIIEYK